MKKGRGFDMPSNKRENRAKAKQNRSEFHPILG